MHCQQRGLVLITTLSAVVFLAVLGSSLLNRGISQSQMSSRVHWQAAAFNLAEAGVNQAALNLRNDQIIGGVLSDPAGDDALVGTLSSGSFTVTAPQQVTGLLYKITSQGTSQQEHRQVEAVLALVPQSIFQFALFGDQDISISGSANTDSYASHDASGAIVPYGGSNVGKNGDIGTNATTPGGVTIGGGGGLFVDGHVAVGPNVSDPTSVVTGYNPALISGDPKVSSQPTTFPMKAVTVPAGCQTALPPASHQVRIFDPTINYCPSGNITINGGDQWTVSGTGTAHIYITGNITMSGNSTIGLPNDPTRMMFLMTPAAGATLEGGTITGSTEFYGMLYGPGATINIQGNAEIYGSVIAEQVNITGSAAIHYDQSLTKNTDITNIYKTTVRSWREI